MLNSLKLKEKTNKVCCNLAFDKAATRKYRQPQNWADRPGAGTSQHTEAKIGQEAKFRDTTCTARAHAKDILRVPLIRGSQGRRLPGHGQGQPFAKSTR
eukprot:1152412-Pelagomonas_calceolata.AAC.2